MDDFNQFSVADDISVIINTQHALVDQPVPTHVGRANAHSAETASCQRLIGAHRLTSDIALVIRHVHRCRRVDHAVLEGQIFGFEWFKKGIIHVRFQYKN